jgi:hypothetical protein
LQSGFATAPARAITFLLFMTEVMDAIAALFVSDHYDAGDNLSGLLGPANRPSETEDHH